MVNEDCKRVEFTLFFFFLSTGLKPKYEGIVTFDIPFSFYR